MAPATRAHALLALNQRSCHQVQLVNTDSANRPIPRIQTPSGWSCLWLQASRHLLLAAGRLRERAK
jgi:hypothetical protein